MIGRDARGACTACKRGLVGPMTGEDEEDVDTSVIMLHYSPYVDVLVNSHATDCRTLYHKHKWEVCDGAACTVKTTFGKAVFLLMF